MPSNDVLVRFFTRSSWKVGSSSSWSSVVKHIHITSSVVSGNKS